MTNSSIVLSEGFSSVSALLDEIIVAHRPGMPCMRPFVFVAVNEAEEDYRNPRVNEQRIEQQIPPRLELSTDFDENNHRQDVLGDHDDH